MRADEKRNGGHTFREHVDVGPAETAHRARTGINARGIQEGRPPAHATRWTSERSAARAAERLWRSPEAQRQRAEKARQGPLVPGDRFVARIPLQKALGGDWRGEVDGHSRGSAGERRSHFTSRSEAVAVWQVNDQRQWFLRTCYPEVTPRPRP